MSDTDNALNITDEDIGKEGRFLVCGTPAVLSDIARYAFGSIYRLAFKVTDRAGLQWFVVSEPDDTEVTRVARKLYIGVERELNKFGFFNSSSVYQTRAEAERVCLGGWAIIEIPHPEDVVK